MRNGDIMSDKRKQVDPLPEEFDSYEAAAEFWDAHDTTDYLESFETVEVESELKRRRYEVEIDEDLMKLLYEQAQRRGVAVGELVSQMLREKIRPAA
jgi:predicted HicB family RNase H-like nuclease